MVRMILALILITRPLVALAEPNVDPSLANAIAKFDQRLEELLPSNPSSKTIRAAVARVLTERSAVIQSSEWHREASRRWRGSEQTFKTQIETLADGFAKAFAEAHESFVRGDAEEKLDDRLGQALAFLGEFFVTNASYAGSNGKVLWSGAAWTWVSTYMVASLGYLWVLFTGGHGFDKVITANLTTSLGVMLTGSMIPGAALSATSWGRTLLMKGGDRPGKRFRASQRLGDAFWARVHQGFHDRESLAEYRPTSSKAEFSSFVFSRFNTMHAGATGACAAWLAAVEDRRD